jgi:hypothetical protein
LDSFAGYDHFGNPNEMICHALAAAETGGAF